MARILIAATPTAIDALNHILEARHKLTVVSTMSEAQTSLKQPEFDLIMIDVHFDESRMFELLGNIHRDPVLACIPVICISAVDTPILRTMHGSIQASCKAFGAWMYLDQPTYNIRKEPVANSELLRIIERCLTGEDRKDTHASRVEIHKQREELLQLRLALEGEEWSLELEDQVSEFRKRLAEVLLVLSELQITNIAQAEKIAESSRQEDRVSAPVTKQEQSMAQEEMELDIQESEQLGREQKIVPEEEAKSKLGRRELAEEGKKNLE